MDHDRFLSRQEAAVLLGLPLADIDRFIQCGLLDRYRIRKRWVRVLRAQAEELASLDPRYLRDA